MYAPLHSAMNVARLLAKTELDEDQRRFVEMLLASTQLLRDLIEEAAAIQRDTQIPKDPSSTSGLIITSGPISNGPMSILLVNQDSINQIVVVDFLDTLGYRPAMASNENDALQACKRHSYDLILMDCGIPGMDSCRTASAIRAIDNPMRNRIWIFGITESAQAGARERYLESGFDDILIKPILIGSLSPLIERAARELERAAREKSKKTEPMANAEERRSNPERSVIDWGILHRLRGYNQKDRVGLFEELIFGFLEQAAGKISELGRLLVDKNYPRLVQTAHTLKGMSLNFGAVAMARECESFQRKVESELDREMAAALERVKESFSQVQPTLIQFLTTPGEARTDGISQPRPGDSILGK